MTLKTADDTNAWNSLNDCINFGAERYIRETNDLIRRINIWLGMSEREIIREELLLIKKKYGDQRRTEIIEETEDIEFEDLIVEEDMIVAITHGGYIKRNAISLYRSQKRGGKGKVAMGTKEEDFVEHLFVASTHDYILFFTNAGKVYWRKVHEIPQAGRSAKGKAIVNLLQLANNEKITAMMPVREFGEGKFIVMSTKNGIVKKTKLSKLFLFKS